MNNSVYKKTSFSCAAKWLATVAILVLVAITAGVSASAKGVVYPMPLSMSGVDMIAPTILQQPESVAVADGEMVTVSLKADDDSNITYRWYEKLVGESAFRASNVRGMSYSCIMDAKHSGMKLYCVVTDEYGNSTKSAVATVSCITHHNSKLTLATADEGKVASAKVEITAKSPKYTWYAKAPGGKFKKQSCTTSAYQLKMTKANSGTVVYCVVTDAYGNTYKSQKITLKIAVYAKFTTQPKSAFVADGKKITVSIKAQGDKLKVKWYLKESDSSTYRKISCTEKSYTFKMNSDRSGRMMYCIITDMYGNQVKSNTVVLSRLDITSQPESISVEYGKTAKASVEAYGDGLKYQWYVKSPDSDKYVKSSVTKRTYSSTVKKYNSGTRVYCVVTDKYGNSIKSDRAIISLKDTLKITTQPKSTYAHIGNEIKAKVKAESVGNIKYRWYEKAPGSTSYTKTTCTKSTYTATMSEAFAGTKVYCVVRDEFGDKIKTKTVTLKTAQNITMTVNTSDAIVLDGGRAKVVVDAVGTGTLSYQWYYRDPMQMDFKLSKQTGNTYSCKMDAFNDGRQVYCTVSDKYGAKLNSKTVTLQIAADLVWPGADATKTYKVGGGFYWYQKSNAVSPTNIQWYVLLPGETKYIPVEENDGEKIIIEKLGTTGIEVETKEESNGSKIYCEVTDKFGRTVKSYVLTIKVATLKITKQPESQKVSYGYYMNVKVEAEGTGELTYKWYMKCSFTGNVWSHVVQQKTNVFSIKKDSQLGQNIWVYCEITDSYGNKVKTNEVRVYS